MNANNNASNNNASNNNTWLALTEEAALEPELPICDPHHHLWDGKDGYAASRYFVHDYLADIAGTAKDGSTSHNVVSSVFIECGTMFKQDGSCFMAPLGETEFANGQAAMAAAGIYGGTRVAAGIVATAYLTEGDSAAALLDAHMAAAPDRLKGIRQGATHDPHPEVPNHRTAPPAGMLMDARFRQGFAHLSRRNLSFEAWCFHHQIPEVTSLARAFADTTIILDHFGGPLGIGPYAGRRDEVFREWRAAVTELARCDNVYAKLGGLAMPVNGFDWHKRDKPPTSAAFVIANRPYYEHTIEVFGTSRCMFESNFPVDRASVSFTVLWNAFKRMTAPYSASERAQLFHDTATRVYRL